MTPEDRYITQVIDNMPAGTPGREQIAMELRGLIAERVEHGQTMDEVLRQLGDPATLAESYLTAVPLVAVSFWRRAAAKIVDALTFLLVIAPLWWLVWNQMPWGFLVAILLVVFGFCAYIVVAEQQIGQTLGKHLMGIRVVRESGARITIGQSLLRQLPVVLQIFWADALFALFTEKKQRAFELISKTRVVLVDPERSKRGASDHPRMAVVV